MANVTAKSTWGSSKPTPPGMQGMDPWTVTLHYKGRRLTVPFYMGYGHGGNPPTAADVLTSLLLDATSYEQFGDDVDEFTREFGYTSFRDAQRILKAIASQTKRLGKFLREDFDEAIEDPDEWIAEHTDG